MSRDKNTRTLVLLDAHAIIHRAYHALPDFSSSKGEPTGALYGIVTMLLKTITDLEPDYIVACYDVPEPTYRHEAYEEYKAGRAKADEALIIQLKRSKEIFEAFGIPIYEAPGFEADDILGTIVEKVKGENDLSVIIASGDMDTLQLVIDKKVQVYTLRKGIQDTVLYDEDAVKKRFGFSPELLPDYKGLRGDPSDNIPGIQGIGEKIATDLITSIGSLEMILEAAHADPERLKGCGIKDRIITLLAEGDEEARFSKMLATIRTDAPIEFKLPQQTWREGCDPEEVYKVFSEFDFRSLIQRFNDVIGEVEQGTDTHSTEDALEEDKKKELVVLTWLLNSDLTQPSEEDSLQFLKARTLSEAYTKALDLLEKEGLTYVFEKIEKPLIPIVEEMQERGVSIDTSRLKELKGEYEKELKDQETRIWEYAGGEFNINSPQQLGEVLFDKLGLTIKNHKKTSTGAKSTRESELVKLQGEHPIIDEILTYREIAKLLSTYIEPILSLVDESGKLHAEFVQTGTTTGRMSSNHPNLQNIPISSERGRRIRNVFVASKGYTLVALDYSQIELRVAALLSGDQKLLSVFKEGGDIHTAVAAEVFDVPASEVDKEMRRKAKVINFGILYGMGVNALKVNLGTSQSEARQFLTKYFDRFSRLAAYIDEIKAFAHERGYVTTLFGRRRYISGLNSPVPYIRSGAERMAINAPIQGTNADIVKRATVVIDAFLHENKKRPDAHLLLQVHDELIYEVKDEYKDQFAEEASSIMKTILEKEGHTDVPLDVTVEEGKRWGKMRSHDT